MASLSLQLGHEDSGKPPIRFSARQGSWMMASSSTATTNWRLPPPLTGSCDLLTLGESLAGADDHARLPALRAHPVFARATGSRASAGDHTCGPTTAQPRPIDH